MEVTRLSPRQALERQRLGAILIDVRAAHERASGRAAGAMPSEMATLLADPVAHLPDLAQEAVLICQTGARSVRAGEALLQAGYTRVSSIEGGTKRWIADGLPVEVEALDADTSDFNERYSRHLLLPEVGQSGQLRLQGSSVLIVGAGGLGSPSALYLAAAGIGHLRLVDDDLVERSNLQRQVLHTDARVGVPKVESASATLSALNPRTRIEAIQVRAESSNVERLLDGVDVVLDGADNFATRYLLNDACVKLGKPLVYGAVERFGGQASVFDAGRHRGEAPCYRCLFPRPPPPEFAPNCAEAGVLGVVPGIIGLLQANEAIKLLLGLGQSLTGRLLHFDALSMRFRETRLGPDPDCMVCAVDRPFPGYVDYLQFCSGS